MRHKVIITTVSFLILVVVVGGFVHFKQFKLTEPELGPPLAESTETTPSAKVWIGLKNSDDQGTSFDLRAEFLKNGTVIASGEARCITGVTRNADKAKEVTVPLSLIANGDVVAGDVLSLKISTRIGTNPNGTRCAGHSNAVGLRLYYDGATRPSRFGATIPPPSLKDYFLHSGSSDTLDTTAPTATTAKFKDSLGINFKNGNPWQAIGTWSMTATISITLPPDPGEAGKATLAGIDADRDGVRDDIQRYIALTYPDSEKTRAVLTQLTKTQQAFLLDANNKEMSIRHDRDRDDALDCLSYIYGIGTDTAYALSSELRAQMLNTTARSRAYVIADAQLSGMHFPSTPEAERKSRCDFDPDAMRN